MHIVKADLIERSLLDTVGGTIIRGFLVDEIPINPTTSTLTDPNVPGKATEVGGMPQEGDAHPSEKYKSYTCVGHRVSPARDTDAVYVDAIYQRPPSPGSPPGNEAKWTVRFGSSVVQDTTQIDIGGSPIQTQYTTIVERETDLGTEESEITYTNTVPCSVMKARRTISAWAIFPQKPPEEVFAAADKVNANEWQNGAPGTWLCLGVEAETRTEGSSYTAEATFVYNPEGWYAIGSHFDELGRIPTDITTEDWNQIRNGTPNENVQVVGNGLVKAAVQGVADFQSIFNF